MHSHRPRGGLVFAPFGRNEIVQAMARRFVRSVAEQSGEFGVNANHSIVSVEQDDRFGGLLEELIKARGLYGATANHIVMLLHQMTDLVGGP
jgi:hypothetical protein